MLIVVKDFSVKPRHAIAPRAAFVASAILISGMKPPVAAENLEQEPPDTNPPQPPALLHTGRFLLWSNYASNA